MIINSEKVEEIEVDDLIGEDTSEEVSVDKENMSFFYEMMSKNMYSDPISSIVREVTSNCFDAHKEINSEAAVVVEGRYEEDNYMLCFIDKGVGISPERWNTTFKKYLSSTKRDSNKFHGAFGLGSKSPFAYVDAYHIITVYDGIQYEYMMYKKENGIPGAELMNQKPTTSINGTTIKFPIEGGRFGDDYWKFQRAIGTQLMYFDNVYVKGFSFDNNYKIFEADTFKYKVGEADSEMHIVLGKVRYPIKWDLVGLKKINIPIGVKFEIGQLMVTPNREDLRYTDETKAVLIEGITKSTKEIQAYLDSGLDTIQEVKSAFKEEGIRQIKVTKDVSIPFKSGYYGSDSKGNTIHWPFEMPKPYLKQFKGLPIKLPDNPYFIFKVKNKISKGRMLAGGKEETIDLWAYLRQDRAKLPLYRTGNFESNKYKNFHIQDAFLVERSKVSYKKIAAVIGLSLTSKSPRIPHRELGDPSPRATEKLKQEPVIGEWGNKLSLVKYYKKVITDIFVTESLSYDKLEVDLELIKRYSDELQVRRPKVIRCEDKLYASDLSDNITEKYAIESKELDRTGFIVFGENKQRQQLKAIYNLIKPKYDRTSNWIDHKKRISGSIFKILVVNKTDIKRMEELKNSYNIEDFMLKNKVFIEQATKAIIYPIIKDVVIADEVQILIPRIAKLMSTLYKNSMSRWEYESLTKTPIGLELIKIIEEGKLYNKELVEQAHLLVKIAEDLNVFNKIKVEKSLDYDDLKDLCAILVRKGYMPDPLYTSKLTEEEITWMEEWKERGDYLENLSIRSRVHNGLTYKTIKTKAWKSYPKSLKQNKSDKTSLLLLEKIQ